MRQTRRGHDIADVMKIELSLTINPVPSADLLSDALSEGAPNRRDFEAVRKA
jgi:hypothetical protein